MQRTQHGRPYSWICIMGLLLVSCATANMKRQQYVLQHPQLPVDRQNAIVNGEIIQGMGFDEVAASIGKPVSSTQETGPDGRQVTRWMYFKRLGSYTSVYEVRFFDGRAAGVLSDGYRTLRSSGMYSGAMISQ